VKGNKQSTGRHIRQREKKKMTMSRWMDDVEVDFRNKGVKR